MRAIASSSSEALLSNFGCEYQWWLGSKYESHFFLLSAIHPTLTAWTTSKPFLFPFSQLEGPHWPLHKSSFYCCLTCLILPLSLSLSFICLAAFPGNIPYKLPEAYKFMPKGHHQLLKWDDLNPRSLSFSLSISPSNKMWCLSSWAPSLMFSHTSILKWSSDVL